MPARLLFVSKPIGPPYHDGTKCLVRDIALHLRTVTPVVMTSRGAAPFAGIGQSTEHIVTWPVYANAGKFQPGLGQNLRAVWSLLSGADADLWHFVFAPNAKSSLMGSWLKRARSVPALQTIASPPRSFADPSRLVFGDIVVAQSEWTRAQFERAYKKSGAKPPRLEVIPPPVPRFAERSAAQKLQARQLLGVGPDQPLFVYPGDLETSVGAKAVRALVAPLREKIKDAVVVFAYRAKTEQAREIASELSLGLDPAGAKFASDVPDILALLASATAVLFPVDDLWGKVDIPIVLLESMELGVPVIALDKGPLRDLQGVIKVSDTEVATLLEAALSMKSDAERRRNVIGEQQARVRLHHAAETISRAYEALYADLLTASRAYSLER